MTSPFGRPHLRRNEFPVKHTPLLKSLKSFADAVDTAEVCSFRLVVFVHFPGVQSSLFQPRLVLTLFRPEPLFERSSMRLRRSPTKQRSTMITGRSSSILGAGKASGISLKGSTIQYLMMPSKANATRHPKSPLQARSRGWGLSFQRSSRRFSHGDVWHRDHIALRYAGSIHYSPA